MIEQRSKEWLEIRRTHIGSSDCAVIMMDNHPYKTKYKLWREKVLGDETPINAAMQRGIDLEPELRLMIEEKHGVKYPAEVCTSGTYAWMMASLDGLSDDGVILEIKTTNPKSLDNMFQDEIILIPEHWQWQVQHQLAVTNLKEAILLVSDGKRSFEARMSRDEGMIRDLIEKEEHFFREHMMKMKPPSMGKGDYVSKDDAVWESAAAEYILAKAAVESAEERLEYWREQLLSHANSESCKGSGVTVTKYYAQGAIDWHSIPVIKDMDLEPYRKPGAERWRIS